MKPLWPLAFLVLMMGCLLMITGCASRTPATTVAPAVLRDWSSEEECALARALEPVPADSILWSLHDDWARMRREIGIKPKLHKPDCRKELAKVHLIT